jgi:hypothetical protein
MSPALLHILQHSLGCDKYGQTEYRGTDEGDGCWWYSRNRFVTDPKGKDGALCQVLVAQGYLTDHGPQQIAGGMHCYTVTEAGRDAMINESPRAPRLSKSKQRYLYWRRVADAFGNHTFGDFLTNPGFADVRARSGLF